MTATLDRPQMGVMWYPAGEWLVSTPIYPGQQEEIEKAMMCPHGTYEEEKREIVPLEETESGTAELIVVEKCRGCVARRFLRLPTQEQPQEMFKRSTPPRPETVECASYERTYDFGRFQILVRRHDPFPGAPIAFLIHVTTGDRRYAVLLQTGVLLFALAGASAVKMMERVLRLGPERYANVVLLEERRMRKDLPEKLRDARELFAVAEPLGPELLARAAAGFEEQIASEQVEGRAEEIEKAEVLIAENEEKLKELKLMLTAAVAEKAPEGEVKELRDVIADGERFIAELKDNLRKFKEGQQ